MQTSDPSKWPSELQELFYSIQHLVYENKRPANEVVLNDYQLQKMLSVCKRTTASWRANRQITYSKLNGIIVYKLSDILGFIETNKIEKL